MAQFAVAQNAVCGFDPIYQKQLRDPILAQRINAANERIGQKQKSIQAMLQSGKKLDVITGLGGSLYEIPVVVHVIHKGETIGSTNNPSDATIGSMIAFLNEVYAGANIPSGGVSTPVRFTLAKRDPNCQSTNGIVRVNASNDAEYVANGVGEGVTGQGISDANLKSKSRWPADAYYNIWIVWQIWDNDPSTTTNGYAYFPGAGNLDGTVMIGNVANGTAQTLTHEMGHAMGLYHTFQGNETTCGVETSCTTQGDRVCDTDPHRKLYTCPPETHATNKNDCTGNNWGLLPKNIMSYFSCRDRFSGGQGARLLSTLLTERYSLATSLGGTPLPINPIPTVPHPTTVANNANSAIGPTIVKILNQNLYQESDANYANATIAYEDYSCTAGAFLNSTDNHTLEVTTRGSNRQRVKVWLNLNNNTTFEPDELIATSITPSGTTGEYIHVFTLPSSKLNAVGTHKNKPLRLRVASDYLNSPDYSFDTELKYGQMEDYSITLLGGLPVTFGNFKAGIFGNQLKVNWQSLTEKNNKQYLIQVSQDGKTFFTIGEQLSKATNGNSDEAIDYEFSGSLQDFNGVFATLFLISLFSLIRNKRKRILNFSLIIGISCCLVFIGNSCNKKAIEMQQEQSELYLRIAQVDKDGTTQHSKVIRVTKQ